MSALDDAVRGLAHSLKSVAGSRINYTGRRGTKQLIAVPVNRIYEVLGEDNFVTLVKGRDFIVEANELATWVDMPVPGDVIGEYIGFGGDQRVFEVLPLGPKRPCYEPHDTNGVMIVIHTKEIINA